ncbi:hypothetical protein [Rhodopila sp.]|uniref:hypothetical protein n=1 Tax=Rhodopila sp. TaxID=2480087 RepID=UPI003D0A9DC7
MESERLRQRVLRATLCQVERGLFHINYRTDSIAAELHDLPRYQLGASGSEAKRRVERTARKCGFSSVLWDDAMVVTAPLSGAEVPAGAGATVGE